MELVQTLKSGTTNNATLQLLQQSLNSFQYQQQLLSSSNNSRIQMKTIAPEKISIVQSKAASTPGKPNQ